MNIVFNKKTLQVMSLLDSDVSDSSQNILKSMFPGNFNDLNLWNIHGKINRPPIGLTVKMDVNNNPHSLLFRGKEIYISTREDQEKILKQNERDKEKKIEKILPRNLRAAIGSEIIRLWIDSPYTHADIVKSLRDFNFFSDNRIIPVRWGGTFVDAGGYGNMNRSIIFRLHNYHILAKAEIIPSLPQISSTGQYYIKKHSTLNYRRLGHCIKVYGFGPLSHPKDSSKTIFFTMMETETLHPTFRDLCNQYSDEVWVPSMHNKKLFESGGIRKPIYVMPLGIDEIIYRGTETIAPKNLNNMVLCDILGKPFSKGINSFRFFTLFGWSFRKGIDVLIKSFVRAFNSKDDVALIIFSNHVGPDIVLRDTLKYASSIRGSDYPQILFIPGVIPEKEMPSLYKIGHAFIHTSRGEGFSLPQIEASACGLPIISCNHTGMSEYLREDNSFVIRTEEKEVWHPEMHWISGYYHGQLFPKLGEDQIKQAVNHMRFVVNHYEEAVNRNKILKKEVFQKYTWDKTAERISYRIKQIA